MSCDELVTLSPSRKIPPGLPSAWRTLRRKGTSWIEWIPDSNVSENESLVTNRRVDGSVNNDVRRVKIRLAQVGNPFQTYGRRGTTSVHFCDSGCVNYRRKGSNFPWCVEIVGPLIGSCVRHVDRYLRRSCRR